MRRLTWGKTEWPTVVAVAACYLTWSAVAIYGHAISPLLWIVLLALVTTFYWSLVHEIVHGHPTPSRFLNELMVGLPIGWIYPVARFRDSHLEHHNTGELTDPFDDPESWYLAPHHWQQSHGVARAVLKFNNTLFGRMLIGPVIVAFRFLRCEIFNIGRGGPKAVEISKAWIAHFIWSATLVWLLWQYSQVPAWQFATAAYLAISILLIRTYLEHQASEEHGERTVIIEQSCPLAFLFLFNNLHCVHHMHPGIPWYRLPNFYRKNRDLFVEQNNGYVYPSYAYVIRKFFFQVKEPVGHPFLGQNIL